MLTHSFSFFLSLALFHFFFVPFLLSPLPLSHFFSLYLSFCLSLAISYRNLHYCVKSLYCSTHFVHAILLRSLDFSTSFTISFTNFPLSFFFHCSFFSSHAFAVFMVLRMLPLPLMSCHCGCRGCCCHCCRNSPLPPPLIAAVTAATVAACACPLILRTSTINLSPNARVLGVILDKKPSWQPHLQHIKSKLATQTNVLSRLTASTWGAFLRVSRLLYTAVMRPAITTGCSAWWALTSTLYFERGWGTSSKGSKTIVSEPSLGPTKPHLYKASRQKWASPLCLSTWTAGRHNFA